LAFCSSPFFCAPVSYGARLFFFFFFLFFFFSFPYSSFPSLCSLLSASPFKFNDKIKLDVYDKLLDDGGKKK